MFFYHGLINAQLMRGLAGHSQADNGNFFLHMSFCCFVTQTFALIIAKQEQFPYAKKLHTQRGGSKAKKIRKLYTSADLANVAEIFRKLISFH